jgi:hypothetical protein
MEPKSGPTWLGPPTLRLSESRCPSRALSAAGARGHQAFEGDPVSVVAAIKRATWTQVRASVPYKAKGSRLFTGEGRLRVNNGCAGRSPDSSAVPRIADDSGSPRKSAEVGQKRTSDDGQLITAGDDSAVFRKCPELSVRLWRVQAARPSCGAAA